MNLDDIRLEVLSPAPKNAVAVIDQGLGDFNDQVAELSDVKPLHVIAEAGPDQVIGGAIGRTWGQACELQQLWVLETLRQTGVGTRLMDAFEKAAQNRGCALIYLDTFCFQAPKFYEARGYKTVLHVKGFTGGISKFTMQKEFAHEARSS